MIGLITANGEKKNQDLSSTEEDERKNLFEVNETQLDLFFDPEGQPNPFEPENWVQDWIEPQKKGRLWPHLCSYCR